MTSSETLKRRWYVVIFGIIIIIFILVAFWPAIFDRPTPSISLTKINESGIPRGTIIHLSDEDFKEFPMLSPVIRDNTRSGVVYANGTRISYVVGLSWEEADKFNSKFKNYSSNYTTGESETYFEYKGQYYSFTPPTHP
jgi:hypothetical protein